jgi:hypothetical protein
MRSLNRNSVIFCFLPCQCVVAAVVPTESPATDPLMSYWVAPIWHALTFLRPALCGSPAGSSYFHLGSWPYGVDTLAPLNHLFACLRPSPSSAGVYVSTSRSCRGRDGSRYASLSNSAIAAPCRLTAGHPAAYVYWECFALLSTRASRAAPPRLGRLINMPSCLAGMNARGIPEIICACPAH